MKASFEKLISGQHLIPDEMERAFDLIMSGQVNDVQIGGFLTALRIKGETPEEIETAARVMRKRALPVKTGCDMVVDTCGTGGDGASTFNISTAVAFVMAGAGYKVAKHGNRSVSSSSGSADCLEALDVPIDLGPDDAARAIQEKGFCFLFAPEAARDPHHLQYPGSARKPGRCDQSGHRRLCSIPGGPHHRGAEEHGAQGCHGSTQRAR